MNRTAARSVTVIPPTINPLTHISMAATRKRRVAGYARVSTDSDEQFTSYEAQIDYYTQYIRRNPEWEFVKVYTDEGISGTNTKNRTGFNEMIDDAMSGKIDLIVTANAYTAVPAMAPRTDKAVETLASLPGYEYVKDVEWVTIDTGLDTSTIGASTNQHIFIVNPSGYIITCSDSAVFCEHIGKRLDESVTAILPQSGTVASLGTLGGFYASEHYTVISALTDDGALLGHLFVSKDTVTALSIWETILPLFFFISLIVLCLALIFSYASSKYFAKPLRDMADAARRFGRGELNVRVEPTDSTDEIGELTEAFNSMADSLEQSETKRREFIANVSHELKTPMTTISGFADGILDGTIPPESEKKYLQIISSETKRLARLVRSMLELSRLQAKDRATLLKSSFDISEQLRLTLITFADKIDQKHLEVVFNVPEEAIKVLGDVDAITQVIYNLLDNAIKFSRENSPLTISLWKDSKKAYVSIRNCGSTIPEAEIPLLFDRFHKSDRSRSQDRDGVGLGLYIVKTILTNHGEDIAVTSRQGVTDFVFTLALKP